MAKPILSIVLRITIFYDCSGLKRVTLPPTITSIGASAFQNCYQLTSVNLPESLIEIGESAFSRCLCLSSMEIPASVTKIGNSAFLQCSSLPAITVSEDNKHYSSVDGVLYNKDVTTLLWFSPMRNGEFTIPETVILYRGNGILRLCFVKSQLCLHVDRDWMVAHSGTLIR